MPSERSLERSNQEMEKNRLSPVPTKEITFNAVTGENALTSTQLQGTNGKTEFKSPIANVALTGHDHDKKLSVIDEKDETVKEQSSAERN